MSSNVVYPFNVEDGVQDHFAKVPANDKCGTVLPTGTASTYTAFKSLSGMTNAGKLVVKSDNGTKYAVPLLLNS